MDSCFFDDGLCYGKNNSIMGSIFSKMELFYSDYGLIFLTLWAYVFPMMACPMGIINPYGKIILMMGFCYFDDGLKFFILWTYVFPMMACPMGMTIL